MANKLEQLAALGQSMWYDNISRELLDSGEIQALVDGGILGMTSNPAIFKKAITSGTAYDAQMLALARQGLSAEEIYEAMAVDDIQRAADILRPVYDRTNGLDGYISLEVSPNLANDTEGTIEEAKRLAKKVNRPNLMIKIPATPEGIPAIEEMIAYGQNINVTLIFSLDAYKDVMEAYLKGLERRVEAGKPLNNIASVASFFVSRVESLVDSLVAEKGLPAGLKGEAAVANAKLAYQLFKGVFSGPRWETLAAKGASVQRPLWASTSTKDPVYSDVKYVDNLIGPHTVNTAPPETVDAFKDHGKVAVTVEDGLAEAEGAIKALEDAGISMDNVTQQLLDEGVEKFIAPFKQLIDSVEQKRASLLETAGD